jgi:hypothetical protein
MKSFSRGRQVLDLMLSICKLHAIGIVSKTSELQVQHLN